MSQSGLTVRHFERRTIDFPAEFAVCEEHQGQVRFSPTSSAQDRHAIAVRCVDMSPGGVGMQSDIYLPRMCEGVLRVFDPTPVGTREDGTPILNIALEHRVKIRRVYMTGEMPEYFVGTSFIDADSALQDCVERLVESLGTLPEGEGDGHAGS